MCFGGRSPKEVQKGYDRVVVRFVRPRLYRDGGGGG